MLALPLLLASLAGNGVARFEPCPQGETSGVPAVLRPEVELARESKLLEEAQAALKTADLVTARLKAGAAIGALLAHPQGEQVQGWLDLVDRAGHAAWSARDPEPARKAWEKVLEVRLRVLPKDHVDVARARGNLALVRQVEGDVAGTRELQEEIVEALSRSLKPDDLDLQYARGNLALTLESLGEFQRAHELAGRVLEVFTRTLADDSENLQRARLNFARTLSELGRFQAARALEERVLEIRTRTLPDLDPELQKTRKNLARTLGALGDLRQARNLQEKVLEVFSRTLPADHPLLASAREDLAITIGLLGEHEQARALQEQVLEVRSRIYPEGHPEIQSARANLATTRKELGDLEGALALEESVLEVYARTQPEDSPYVQYARINLGVTLWGLGRFEEARTLLGDVLGVVSRRCLEDDPALRLTRANLAIAIAGSCANGASGASAEDQREFAALSSAYTGSLARFAQAAMLTGSSREAEERCSAALPHLDYVLSFAAGLGVLGSDAGLERQAFALSEQTRSAALAWTRVARGARTDPRYGELRGRMRAASDELARLAQRGAAADDLDRARARRESAEKSLIGLAHELGGGVLDEPAASSLSAALGEHDALVAFRCYECLAFAPDAPRRLRWVMSLCAYVVRSKDRFDRVELGSTAPIEAAVERWRAAIGARGERGGAVQARVADGSPASGVALRRLVFDPLAGVLKDVDRVVVALDDVLELVPLDALPLDPPATASESARPELVGDRWRIETRCSLAELLWKEVPLAAPTSSGALLALGGASFELEPLGPDADESAALDPVPASAPKVSSLLRGGAWERGFEPLTNSGPEARGIATVYREAFGEGRPVLVLEERKASRQALAELSSRARFLHIATHAWFAPESVRSAGDRPKLDPSAGFGSPASGADRARAMSPMLLCGFALAGADLPPDETGRAPGLVTAEEVSTLDLSGCELAVLSACDTNVGVPRAGQGVASLQRALHMAGARSVITSLWKVPDEATRELMLDFYRRMWIEKKPKSEALWEAKRKLREARDERGRPLYSTRDWAAWVLTGDPD